MDTNRLQQIRVELKTYCHIDTSHLTDEELQDAIECLDGVRNQLMESLASAVLAALPDIGDAVEALGYGLVSLANIISVKPGEDDGTENQSAESSNAG